MHLSHTLLGWCESMGVHLHPAGRTGDRPRANAAFFLRALDDLRQNIPLCRLPRSTAGACVRELCPDEVSLS